MSNEQTNRIIGDFHLEQVGYRNKLNNEWVDNVEHLINHIEELELEVSELQRCYNDSQKEIVVLNNTIRRLKNGKMRQV